jgi:hypothetical protein
VVAAPGALDDSLRWSSRLVSAGLIFGLIRQRAGGRDASRHRRKPGRERCRPVADGQPQTSKACEGATPPWVQIPPPPHRFAHFPRFRSRLNTRRCVIPIRGKRTGQRRQAVLQAPVWAGNPPRAHRLGNCVGGAAVRIAASPAVLPGGQP